MNILHHDNNYSYELFKAIFEAADDGIVLADAESGKLVLGNKSAMDMLGYTEEELLELRVDSIHPEKDLPRVLEQFRRQFQGEARVSRYTPVLRKDASIFYADIAASPIKLGNRNYLIGFFRDVTELKELESDLRENIHKLEVLNNIAVEISSSLEPDLIFEKAVELSASLIGGQGGTLAIYDFKEDRMTYPYHYNMPGGSSSQTARKGSGIAELVMHEGPMILDDYPAHPRALKAFTDAGVKAMVAVPLAVKGKVIGALGIFSFTGGKEFSSKDLKILEAVGRQVAVAIENASLYEKVRRDMVEIEHISSNLKRSEEKFRSIVETVNDWIWEVDSNALYTYASPRVKDLLGYEPAEILGKSPFDLMPEGEAESIRAKFMKMMTLKKDFSNLENWNLHKDGHYVLMESSGTPLVDCRGNLLGYRGIDRDITGQKRAQEAVRRSEEKYRSIVENSFDVILTIDDQCILSYVSPAISRLVGFDSVELVGTDCRKFFTEEDSEVVREIMSRIGRKETVEMKEVRLRKSDDNTFLHVELNASPIIEEGEVTGAQLILRDVTEKRQLETQLRQKQKIEAIGTLTAGITHDFNNILGIIMGNTELAIRTVTENDPVKPYLDQVMSASVRASQIVRQLLQFSRSSAEESKPVSIIPLVRESVELLRATTPSTIEIRESFSAANDAVLADPTQIQQVFINLCTNAVHAMARTGGVLEIRIENVRIDQEKKGVDPDMEPGEYVRLSVADTGYGMTPEIMSRMYDPYFSTKPMDEGSGMGLAVVHGIVRKYAGRIEVESEPDKGSVFSIDFPAIVNEKGYETEVPRPEPTTGEGRIMLVDDESMLVSMWKELLTSVGYQVEGFTDPVAALDAFSAGPDRFDLVVTDMNMPKISGDRFSREILDIRPDIPVLICTGHGCDPDREESCHSTVTGYIEKPVQIMEMAEKIREMLKRDSCSPGSSSPGERE